jgi:hypothetical protein
MFFIAGNNISPVWTIVLLLGCEYLNKNSKLLRIVSTSTVHFDVATIGFLLVISVFVAYFLYPVLFIRHGRNNNRNETPTDRIISIKLLATKIGAMPIESFVSSINLVNLNTVELLHRLRNRGLDESKLIEKDDIIKMIISHHSFSQSSCVICCEEFEESPCFSGVEHNDGGALIRILSGCHHAFHVECIDRWVYSAPQNDGGSLSRSCPICNKPL